MALQAAAAYPRRRNADGSYDSVCMTCFATIGSKRKEEDLAVAEKNHTCKDSPLSLRMARAAGGADHEADRHPGQIESAVAKEK